MPKIGQNGVKRREKNTKYQLNILFSVYVQSRPMKKFKKYLNQKINLNIFEILSKIYIFKIHFGIPPSGDFLKSSASEVFPRRNSQPTFLSILTILTTWEFLPRFSLGLPCIVLCGTSSTLPSRGPPYINVMFIK